ncbi:hypothetical protein CSW62_06585 [Caulobacter sp. FWC2]|nr:hypothetical protein CSW62_06585 [Caulobacter sp. FWC2]
MVMSGGDWLRVIGYATQAAEDQRRSDELAARAHAGRVMASRLMGAAFEVGARDPDAAGGTNRAARNCRRQREGDAGKGVGG